jgi:hypothetical protein
MRFAWIGWAAAAFLACGGNMFTSGSQGADASMSRGAGADVDAAPEAGPEAESPQDGAPSVETDGGLRCGPYTCSGATPACCVSVAQGTYGCAHDTCGCETQLDCRRKDDCPGAQVCCITTATSSACADPHSLAQCRDATSCVPPNSYVLCEPSLGGCGTVLTCKQDAATLTKLGLPLPPADFGVCGT